MKFRASYFIITIGLLFEVLCSSAQQKALTINDPLPNLRFQNLYNAPFASVSLSELKGKAVLIDYWSIRCGACLEKLRTTADLQRRYKEDLQVIMVSPESKQEVAAFYQKRPHLKALNLPTVTGEKALLQLFPARAVPHLVWVGKDRRVQAITGGEQLTPENIERLIRGEAVNLPVKKDLIDFDYENNPLLTNGSPVLQNLVVSSTLTNRVEGASGRIGLQRLGNITKITATNQSLLGLYLFAYRKRIALVPSMYKSRVVVEVDSLRRRNLPPLQRNAYCYELLFPVKEASNGENQTEALDYMQKDLDRLFRLKTSVQKRQAKCYVFIPADTATERGSEMTLPYETIKGEDSTLFRNVPLTIVLNHLRSAYGFSLPVVYDAPPAKQLNIVLPNTFTSLEGLQAALRSVGYDLREEERPLDMLVFEERVGGF